MESKRLTARAMLQRAVALTRHAHELQSSSSLTAPPWHNNWLRLANTNSDTGQGLGAQSSVAPTYALGPQRRFDILRAKKCLQSELNRRCARISTSLRYDPIFAVDLVQDLTQQLRRIMKSDILNNIRYKIIVFVTIVQVTPNQQRQQSMAIASRALWNYETDGSVTVQARLGYDMVAIATAFAIYTD